MRGLVGLPFRCFVCFFLSCCLLLMLMSFCVLGGWGERGCFLFVLAFLVLFSLFVVAILIFCLFWD